MRARDLASTSHLGDVSTRIRPTKVRSVALFAAVTSSREASAVRTPSERSTSAVRREVNRSVTDEFQQSRPERLVARASTCGLKLRAAVAPRFRCRYHRRAISSDSRSAMDLRQRLRVRGSGTAEAKAAPSAQRTADVRSEQRPSRRCDTAASSAATRTSVSARTSSRVSARQPHAQVEHLAGLLAADVGRFARLDVHRRPLADVVVERARDALPRASRRSGGRWRRTRGGSTGGAHRRVRTTRRRRRAVGHGAADVATARDAPAAECDERDGERGAGGERAPPGPRASLLQRADQVVHRRESLLAARGEPARHRWPAASRVRSRCAPRRRLRRRVTPATCASTGRLPYSAS